MVSTALSPAAQEVLRRRRPNEGSLAIEPVDRAAAVEAEPRAAPLQAPIRVHGKFFFAGAEKFFVKGVTYGPFASGLARRAVSRARNRGARFRADGRAGRQHAARLHRAAAVAPRPGRRCRAPGAGRHCLGAARHLSRQCRYPARDPPQHRRGGARPRAASARSSPISSATRFRRTWCAGMAPSAVRSFLKRIVAMVKEIDPERAGELRQLPVDRVSDRRFHRFPLLQRLSAPGGGVPALSLAAAQSRARPAAGADRVRHRLAARGRGAAGADPVLAGARRLRVGRRRRLRLRLDRRMVHRRPSDRGLGLRPGRSQPQPEAGLRRGQGALSRPLAAAGAAHAAGLGGGLRLQRRAHDGSLPRLAREAQLSRLRGHRRQ